MTGHFLAIAGRSSASKCPVGTSQREEVPGRHNGGMTHPTPTVAAIDCGTNSIKVLVGAVRDDGTLDVHLRDSRVVRLGQGVDETGVLAEEALERTFAAIDELAAVIRDHVAVYPALMDSCTVDGEVVTPQPGGFYGGWITPRVVGPFKGAPGTRGW